MSKSSRSCFTVVNIITWLYQLTSCSSQLCNSQTESVPEYKLNEHVISKLAGLSIDLCTFKCSEVTACYSINHQSSREVCELNNKTRRWAPSRYWEHNQDWFYMETLRTYDPCKVEQPCRNGATCVTRRSSHTITCECTEGYMGQVCSEVDPSVPRWVQQSTSPVCFGAKDDSFGTFNTTQSGTIRGFRLDHVSGKVTCDVNQPTFASNWGCRLGDSGENNIWLVLTYKNNSKIFPTDSDSYFTLPAVTNNDATLELPELVPGLNVTKEQEFRIWFSEDLTNFSEEDNGESSKTDHLREGAWVTISRTDLQTCPVAALEGYISAAGVDLQDDLPLFRALSGPRCSNRVRAQGIGYTRGS